MNKFISLCITIVSALLFTGTAMADQKCKSVDIYVKNFFGKRIKVLKVNYWDAEDRKWRDNDLSNTEIPNNWAKTINETLEYVGNEEVHKMQVRFQYEEDDGDWSDKVWSNVTDGLGGDRCVKDLQYPVEVFETSDKR